MEVVCFLCSHCCDTEQYIHRSFTRTMFGHFNRLTDALWRVVSVSKTSYLSQFVSQHPSIYPDPINAGFDPGARILTQRVESQHPRMTSGSSSTHRIQVFRPARSLNIQRRTSATLHA